MTADKSSKEKKGVLDSRILLYTLIQGWQLVYTKSGMFQAIIVFLNSRSGLESTFFPQTMARQKSKLYRKASSLPLTVLENIFKQKSSAFLPSFVQNGCVVQGINNREALGRGPDGGGEEEWAGRLPCVGTERSLVSAANGIHMPSRFHAAS